MYQLVIYKQNIRVKEEFYLIMTITHIKMLKFKSNKMD